MTHIVNFNAPINNLNITDLENVRRELVKKMNKPAIYIQNGHLHHGFTHTPINELAEAIIREYMKWADKEIEYLYDNNYKLIYDLQDRINKNMRQELKNILRKYQAEDEEDD